jgi:hypothetical protein
LNTIYIVKVEAKGQIFKVWLNGILRIEASNQDFTFGTVGIMAWSSASERVHLDYVYIRDASPLPGVPSAYSLSVRAEVTEIIVTCAWAGSGNITVKLVNP